MDERARRTKPNSSDFVQPKFCAFGATLHRFGGRLRFSAPPAFSLFCPYLGFSPCRAKDTANAFETSPTGGLSLLSRVLSRFPAALDILPPSRGSSFTVPGFPLRPFRRMRPTARALVVRNVLAVESENPNCGRKSSSYRGSCQQEGGGTMDPPPGLAIPVGATDISTYTTPRLRLQALFQTVPRGYG